MSDDELLRHYLARASPEAAAWNLSWTSAYIDYRFRRWADELIASLRPVRVLNVGIGVGEWDDFLGYALEGGGRLASIDIDPAICETLERRQQREGHPNPARVARADLLAWRPTDRFDLVTMVGTTVAEIGDFTACVAAGVRLLAPRGALAIMTVGDANAPLTLNSGARRCHVEIDETLEVPLRLVRVDGARA